MPTTTGHVVTVCFAPGDDADWFTASEKVNNLLDADGTPARRYRIRHRRLIGWLTRFLSYYLLDPVRRFGAVTTAAGGRKSRLDLTGTAANAAHEATLRWRAWHTHINATTPVARPWEDYLAQHLVDPTTVRLAEARRRFEQQPRVLAMLAHSFDPYELSVYQAGEATYVGLYWRVALIGDALITTDGRLLIPASDSAADRLRFLNEACAYIRGLRSAAHLCAIAIS
ncbi:hypothetical protein AB0H57_30850 [Micromonospora sp. NPDC050686]|uniref:hypothetical protein n=1 Tax=Micromonospora sp. NPDC050686 TaxID=3154631 RepID=UPI0033D405D2